MRSARYRIQSEPYRGLSDTITRRNRKGATRSPIRTRPDPRVPRSVSSVPRSNTSCTAANFHALAVAAHALQASPPVLLPDTNRTAANFHAPAVAAHALQGSPHVLLPAAAGLKTPERRRETSSTGC